MKETASAWTKQTLIQRLELGSDLQNNERYHNHLLVLIQVTCKSRLPLPSPVLVFRHKFTYMWRLEFCSRLARADHACRVSY